MAFDKATRNLLAKMVAACRDRLVEDIRDQLQSNYGLYPDGTILDVARTERERLAAADLRDLLEHFVASEAGTEKKHKKAAYQRLVREIGFTTLNRLVALRLCEERGIVIECIGKGMESDGFRLYDRMTGGALGNRYQTYHAFLEGLFDEIALDLGVLFDRDDPQSHIFPSESALNDVLAQLTDPELDKLGIWEQDETIGWIYQYYNDPKERKSMRDASQTPRNSRELAVRNQFFTPRYVVEFLTDNTLGRIWYEMRGGETQLVEECQYLVRTPEEQENQIPNRPKKDPRDLKILDPACGSGHFLLYAFDLLCIIYEEAWEDSDIPPYTETGTWLANDYSDLESLNQEIPCLILRHNLFGVDIDPRTIQIAALALWLRSQRKYEKLELKPVDRPRITKTNLVVAEPMPGDQALLNEFVHTLFPPLLCSLVRVVFDKMKLTGEAGTLLNIEEELKDAISAAKSQWLARPKAEQLSLWSEEKRPKSDQLSIFDLSGITDNQFWKTAEDQLLEAIINYAEYVSNGQETRRRLFAEDAVKGFAFIDLCRNKYDVIVMNPPFGEVTTEIINLIEHNTPSWNKNVLCGFFDRQLNLLNKYGLLGAIFDRTAVIKTTYESFRREVILIKGRMQTQVDLGWDVLDANVETSAIVLSSHSHQSPEQFFDVTSVPTEEKAKKLLDAVIAGYCGKKNKHLMIVDPAHFATFPNAVVTTQFPSFLINLFSQFPSLERSGFKAFVGHSFKSERHFRLRWEISEKISIRFNKSDWTMCFNGGEFFPLYKPCWDIAYYGEDGELIKNHKSVTLRNIEKHGKLSVGYGKRGEFVDAQILPPGSVFTVEGEGANVEDSLHAYYYVCLINSWIFQFVINTYCGQHKYPGYVNQFPAPRTSKQQKNELGELAQEIYTLKLKWYQGDETDTVFKFPQLLFSEIRSLKIALAKILSEADSDNKSIKNLWLKINETIRDIYTIDCNDWKLILEYVKRMPKDTIWLELTDDQEANSHIFASAFMSYLFGIVTGRWDIRYYVNPSITYQEANITEFTPTHPTSLLLGSDGLPAISNKIVSENWLKARPDALKFPKMTDQGKIIGKDGKEYAATILDSEYPIKIQWDGILVDDPGLDEKTLHPSDIVLEVREVLKMLWPENHVEIESEVCEVLGVNDLREYFRKPNKFFAEHLNRYTKSHRKAPIYWPLSTTSGSYTLWIYYQRLDEEILYTAINRYVEPKIASVERHIAAQERELLNLTGKAVSDLKDKFDVAQAFLVELREFRDELLRIAALPYKPNLNDGVIINAAPFYKLYGLSKWAKDTKAAWDKLETGEYDWAHLAYTIWPERVQEVCKKDKSIAIAHGLEELYQG